MALPQPLAGNDMPRFCGPATFMRLPPTDLPVDTGIIGVPLDVGTSNRPGARFGPRAIRAFVPGNRRQECSTRSVPPRPQGAHSWVVSGLRTALT